MLQALLQPIESAGTSPPKAAAGVGMPHDKCRVLITHTRKRTVGRATTHYNTPLYCHGWNNHIGNLQLTILLAVSDGANNHSVLLARVIVESEDVSSWRFFLSNLCAAIPEVDHPATTFMSDRDKGLCAARKQDYTRCPGNLCRSFPQRSKELGSPSRIIFNSPILYVITVGKIEIWNQWFDVQF